MTRYREWMPVNDPRVRCPAGHVFKPRAQVMRGHLVVGCGICHARIIVVVASSARMKLVCEVNDADVVSLDPLSEAGVIVYLLTTPLKPDREAQPA